MAYPLPEDQLEKIVANVCETTIGASEKYEHSSVTDWNTQKYIVNSTIIQHHGSGEATGRRGMHSAVGAYWNSEKDGTYSYKWDAADKVGMDIVISVTWIAL
ncbi:hypothetical protein K504DRAFT_271474 [Pleomassaria siparia CBS 279.74]|uniref:Tctex-1 n=1 Tax=Pleomassaria siparia CBS 279.74 TaxID=1314801 RepID=A0A6G1KAA7_9PLEO|nr:hypothetical protein K504DRAFT_271474 [Pleomassaria siparia CBS 279.74]